MNGIAVNLEMAVDLLKKYIKLIPLYIALVQWFLTTVFQVDRLYFTYDTENSRIWTIKILYLLFLIAIWQLGAHIVQKVQEGDHVYTRRTKFFGVYLFLLMGLLLALWPGTWAWDDAFGLNAYANQYDWNPWQHIITAIYQEVLLQILPFPGGIILLQNIMIAALVAAIIMKLENAFPIPVLKNSILDMGVKLIPFMLPPVLIYQFSGYRLGLYVYFELFVLTEWVCLYKMRKEWNTLHLVRFGFLLGVLSTWRTESLLYIPFAIVSFAFMNSKVFALSKRILLIGVMLSTFFFVNAVQSECLKNDNYKAVSFIRQCTVLVRVADPAADKLALSEIDKVAKVNVILQNKNLNGEELYFFHNLVREKYSKNDFREFIDGVIRLSIKYPNVLIKERSSLFVQSLGKDAVNNINSAYSFYDANNGNKAADLTKSHNFVADQPAFPKLRKKVISFLGMQNESGNLWAKKLIWNTWIPLFVLVVLLFRLLLKKKWGLCWIVSALLIKVPIIFLTEPAGWFMYYLSFYFIGYVILVYGFLALYGEGKLKWHKFNCQS